MPEGQSGVDSPEGLNVHEAANAFEGFFAAQEAGTEKTPDSKPSKEAAKPAPKAEAPAPDAAEDDDEPAASAGDEATADGEPDDDAEAEPKDDEESDTEPEQPADTTKHKVKVRGEEVEVTLDEALKGYSRTADYTRDKQKLADERRAFDAEKTATAAERQQLHAKITAFDEAMKAQEVEPDWDALRAQDPDLFVQAHAAWSVQKERRALVTAERQRLERQLAEQAAGERQQHITRESQLLLEKAPEFGDPTTGKQALADLFDYGQRHGYSADELTAIGDHRAMLLLRKAMLYDKQQADTAKKTAKAELKIEKVKTASPGSATVAKPKATEFTRSKQRLAKTGKVEDAARAFEHFFGS
jgi:hypothetical protein